MLFTKRLPSGIRHLQFVLRIDKHYFQIGVIKLYRPKTTTTKLQVTTYSERQESDVDTMLNSQNQLETSVFEHTKITKQI